MGIGIALVMSPMSTAAMNAVSGAEGRGRLRRPVDDPHGRRHLRRRRDRRDLPVAARQPASILPRWPRRPSRRARRSSTRSAARCCWRRSWSVAGLVVSRDADPRRPRRAVDDGRRGRARRGRGRGRAAHRARDRRRLSRRPSSLSAERRPALGRGQVEARQRLDRDRRRGARSSRGWSARSAPGSPATG